MLCATTQEPCHNATLMTALVRSDSALGVFQCTTDHRYAQNIRIDGRLRAVLAQAPIYSDTLCVSMVVH